MRTALIVSLLIGFTNQTFGDWRKTATQIPDYGNLLDESATLQQQIDDNDGNLLLTKKLYRLTRPLHFDLEKHGAAALKSVRGATLIMNGPGPAVLVTGTHKGTASPRSFAPKTWNERMPIISGIEVLGAHPEADGIELQYTVAAIVSRVSVRWCRHGIRLAHRNRNVIISDSHLYENSGIGIFLDDVNLHQINVSNSHVSYNRAGGVVVRDGNVRNLHVTGCDIEGNMPADETPTTTANVLIDVTTSADDKSKSIAEIAITGCTIQHSANYSRSKDKTVAPGGANIRIAGKKIYPINSIAITGNVLSDTTTNIDIDYSHDVTISGNTFFAPKNENLVATNSQRIVVSGNTFNPRQFVRPGTIKFRECADCIVSNSTIHKFATPTGALIIDRCSGFSISGLNLSDCDSGIAVKSSTDLTIANCRVTRTNPPGADLSVDQASKQIILAGNSFSGEVAGVSSKASH